MKEIEIKELETLREEAKISKLKGIKAMRFRTLKKQEELEKAKRDEKEAYAKIADLFWVKNLKKIFRGEQLLEVLEDEKNAEIVIKACEKVIEEIKIRNNIVEEIESADKSEEDRNEQ